PLERLLVERIAITWLQVHHADLGAAAAQTGGSGTGPRCAHAQRRLGQAQARYLQAVKQLAQVSKLLRPAISPVDLARRPVGETSVPRAVSSRGRNVAREAVPVEN